MALYIGLISGTSMDAVDAALVEITDDKINTVDFHEHTIPADLKQKIRSIDGNTPLSTIAHMDALLGEFFAEAAMLLMKQNQLSRDQIAAIGSHGQTVYHEPTQTPPCTMQIGDPNIIAARTGIQTVADFRRMDLAFAGEGAPLAPFFHAEQFRAEQTRGVLNLGGFANITILPGDMNEAVTGFDTGPASALMDDWIQLHLDKPFDENGQWAASGKVSESLLNKLLDEPYFSQPAPKSTGRDDFHLAWLMTKLTEFGEISPEDVQATLMALTVESVALDIEKYAVDIQELIVCGGGAYNKELMRQLSSRLDQITIYQSSEFGIEPNEVEAICFAWLAYRRLHQLPGNLPSVTSAAKACLLGGVYKAN